MDRLKNNIKLNNRGIALVSIMIAVSFVSIIGSALLFITYNNFRMKVINLESKENFYETDGKLIEVTTALRNASTGDADKIKACFTEVPEGSGHYVYDLTSIYNDYNIEPVYDDLKNNDHFVLSTTGTAVAPTKEGSSITVYTIPDFRVTQTTSEGKRHGLKNSVSTTIEIKVREISNNSGGPKGVGDFSVLMDSGIKVNGNNFSFLTIYGDAYFSSYYYGSSGNEFESYNGSGKVYTMPGSKSNTPALYMKNDSKVNILGDYCVVFGDLVLTNKSCLYIHEGGKLFVYGDIYLEDQSTLICGGQILMPTDTILPGRHEYCTIHCAKNGAFQKDEDHLFYSGGISAIKNIDAAGYVAFCDTLDLNDGNKDTDGIASSIMGTLKDQEYGKTDGVYTGAKKDFNFFKDFQNTPIGGPYTKDYYGTDLRVIFLRTDDDGTIKSQLADNSLVFLAGEADPWGNTNIKLHASAINSTIVSKKPLYLECEHGVYLTKLKNQYFNFLTITDDTDPYYNDDIHDFSFNFSGGSEVGSGNFFHNGGTKMSAGDLIPADEANKKVSELVSKALSPDGGGPITYDSVISFKNMYRKDPD